MKHFRLILATLALVGNLNAAAIHLAARIGSSTLVQRQLKKGVSAKLADKHGNTPLHYTSSARIAKLLLDNGADPSAKNNEGLTPLHMVPLKLSLKEPITGNLAETLIEGGGDVNATDKGGNTPLHDAARFGRVKMIELLLAHKANASAQNKERLTPLHAAVSLIQTSPVARARNAALGISGAAAAGTTSFLLSRALAARAHAQRIATPKATGGSFYPLWMDDAQTAAKAAEIVFKKAAAEASEEATKEAYESAAREGRLVVKTNYAQQGKAIEETYQAAINPRGTPKWWSQVDDAISKDWRTKFRRGDYKFWVRRFHDAGRPTSLLQPIPGEKVPLTDDVGKKTLEKYLGLANKLEQEAAQEALTNKTVATQALEKEKAGALDRELNRRYLEIDDAFKAKKKAAEAAEKQLKAAQQKVTWEEEISAKTTGQSDAAKEQADDAVKKSSKFTKSVVVGVIIVTAIILTIIAVDTIKRHRTVQKLIDGGANVNAKDIDGNTPLHRLAAGKRFKSGERKLGIIAAHMLLDAGANPNTKNKAGLTPYQVARRNYRLILAAVLKPSAAAKRQKRRAWLKGKAGELKERYAQ